MRTIKRIQKITPFLWFDNRAEEAMNFYVTIFPNSEITQLKKWPEKTPFPAESAKPGTVQQGVFTLDGVQFCAFDAGPMFKFNPSISFFAIFETHVEVDAVWSQLIDGGQILMPLDSYDWSERYGWVSDRFGVSWQIYKGKLKDVGQRISPLIMYSGKQRGNAEGAMEHYMSIFKNASSEGVAKYTAGEPGPEGMVKHAQCKLNGQTFMMMDNGTDADIPFTEAISFYVNCEDQEEVDYFWDRFTKEGSESVCGWLKDKFGVSWQIVPQFLTEKLALDEPEKRQKLFEAISQMKKLDVAKLEEAYNR
ncbi:VOC family protein [Aequorivita todarodis]|uniref:VOC family protein n=1 Tax=Aequorivita todarodis TaxID=2036821 RepID=UPI002350D143|nr:VOC family protein [Aequorivita todarodis]MDC7999923.1 VOC family protein [Aequorivita todarodis]